MEKVTLNKGVTRPILFFLGGLIPDAAECERGVLDAIDTGCRSIDTAQIYGNEEAVGRIAEKRQSAAREIVPDRESVNFQGRVKKHGKYSTIRWSTTSILKRKSPRPILPK